MKYAINRGLDKYGYKDGDPEAVVGKNHHHRCQDGTLNMNFKINKGLDKYNFKDELTE